MLLLYFKEAKAYTKAIDFGLIAGRIDEAIEIALVKLHFELMSLTFIF